MVATSAALDLGRFVNDLLSWAGADLYRLADDLVQGSSIMPQKRNPVALEHARTRLSRALGSAGMVTYSSHNIPFTDLNDFGPDIQGGLVTLHRQLGGALELVAACLSGGDCDRGRLAQAAAATDTTATELADVLARDAGLGFPAAHRVVADLVGRLAAEGRPLSAATPDDLVAVGGPRLESAALAQAVDPAAFVARRAGVGMPAPAAMSGRLVRAEERLGGDLRALRERKDALAAARARLREIGKEQV